VLVIVGHENWPKEDLHLVNEPNVVSIPILDDSDLAILYSHTVAFIYLSLDEGFGLPVVEAMSMGAPVIVSRRGALPEVVGSAGFQVEPEDEDQVRNAMALLLSSSTERVRQRELSIKRAGSFSWKDAANDLVECISQITS
jgi:glycosyltransferase involved in cell wall biosynthesis